MKCFTTQIALMLRSWTYCIRIYSTWVVGEWKKLPMIKSAKKTKGNTKSFLDPIHTLWYQNLCDVYVNPIHSRWYTNRECDSNPLSISECQRWSSDYTSCSSESWAISNSSASSFSFPYLWTSLATPCNSVSLRPPFSAKRYRNGVNFVMYLLMKLESIKQHSEIHNAY